MVQENNSINFCHLIYRCLLTCFSYFFNFLFVMCSYIMCLKSHLKGRYLFFFLIFQVKSACNHTDHRTIVSGCLVGRPSACIITLPQHHKIWEDKNLKRSKCMYLYKSCLSILAYGHVSILDIESDQQVNQAVWPATTSKPNRASYQPITYIHIAWGVVLKNVDCH